MSHVDEGALHAYLDGALDEYPAADARRIREHVEACPVCMEALAAERKVREEAHEILSLAAPAVEVPTFEELRAYVRASRPTRTTAMATVYRLSWAASVVLALGTGYMLRGGDVVPIAPLERSGLEEIRSVQEAPAEAAPGSGGPASEPAIGTLSVEADALENAAPARPSDVAAPTTSAPVTSAPAQDASVDGRTLGAAASAPSAPPTAQQGAQYRVEPFTSGRDFADAVTQGAPSLSQGAAAPPSAPAAAAAAGGNRVAERIDSAARANQPERRVAATQDVVVTSAIDAAADPAAALRQRAENERTSQDEDTGSLVVPGLEVLDVLPVGEGTTFAGMRALQRLESGDTLELMHLPQAIDPSFLPPLRPGLNELVRQRGEGWLVMRGPVTERYLEELLQRLEGAR